MTRAALTITIALPALLLASAVEGYYVETRATGEDGAPVPMRAATVPVEFRIGVDTLPEGASLDAVRSAFATWEGVPCSTLSFVEGPAEAAPEDVIRPEFIVVFWSENPWYFQGPAVAHFFSVHSEGELRGGLIALNKRDHAWSTEGARNALDVQSVVTAVVGRTLGITSTEEGNATTRSYAPGDTGKRTLGPDDIAAIQYLYGDGTCDATVSPEGVCNEMGRDANASIADEAGAEGGPNAYDGGFSSSDAGDTQDGSTPEDAGAPDAAHDEPSPADLACPPALQLDVPDGGTLPPGSSGTPAAGSPTADRPERGSSCAASGDGRPAPLLSLLFGLFLFRHRRRTRVRA